VKPVPMTTLTNIISVDTGGADRGEVTCESTQLTFRHRNQQLHRSRCASMRAISRSCQLQPARIVSGFPYRIVGTPTQRRVQSCSPAQNDESSTLSVEEEHT
jgi:hypothetical protein